MAETNSLAPQSSASFPTKVDRWLAAALLLALALGLMTAIYALRADARAAWLTLGILGASVLLVAALSIPTEYVLAQDELIVRFGLFKTRIPYEAIERVRPTRNPLSAPAWSLDRIAIDYRTEQRRGVALVSPARPREFLEMLQARAALESSGTELRRSAAESAGPRRVDNGPRRPGDE